MIIFDCYGHMVSDASEQELQEFARSLGISNIWRHSKNGYPQYDLVEKGVKAKARAAGAYEVSPKQLVQQAFRR